MISNTDSTLLIYFTEHMRVKAYKGRGPGNGFSRRAGMHRLMLSWRGGFMALRAPAASALWRGGGALQTRGREGPPKGAQNGRQEGEGGAKTRGNKYGVEGQV